MLAKISRLRVARFTQKAKQGADSIGKKRITGEAQNPKY